MKELIAKVALFIYETMQMGVKAFRPNFFYCGNTLSESWILKQKG